MKIHFVDHAGDPGGGQLGLLRYVASSARSHNVSCSFLSGGPIVAKVRQTGVSASVPSNGGTFVMRKMPLYTWWLWRDLRRTEADAVVANSLYAAFAMSFIPRRAPAIYYSRVSFDSLRGWKRVLTEQWIFRRFDGFLANSKWTASCLPKSVADRPVKVAYPISGLNQKVLGNQPSEILDKEELRIVSLSRPDRWKGIDLIIRAADHVAREMPRTRVVLNVYGGSFYSDAAYQTELHELAANSVAEVNFCGHVEDVWPILDAHDVVVLGTRQPEPFGQVVVQGLAAARLMVVSDAGGPLELIDDGSTGRTYEMGDAEDLARVLLEIVADPAVGRELAHRGRAVANSFSDDEMVRCLEADLSTMCRPSVAGDDCVSKVQSEDSRC